MPYFVKYSMIAKNKLINNFTIDNLAVRFSDKDRLSMHCHLQILQNGFG